MSGAVFLSGWAGVPALYPELSRRCRFLVPFLDGDEAACIEAVTGSRADVLMAWSTGAHMVLKHAAALLPRFSRVVLAAPFLRFTDSFPARLVKSMIARMEVDPEGTGRDFWRSCGFADPAAWQPEWAGPLTEGLRYLLASQAPAEPMPAGHVLVVHGVDDRIVRAPAVDKAMAGLAGAKLDRVPGGHLLDETLLLALLHERPHPPRL